MLRAATRSSPTYRAYTSRSLSLVAIAAALLLTANMYGATYYIGPSGDNGNSGTSEGSPWGTFDFAFGELVPGDTLLVLDGTYNINSRVQWSSGGGTSGNPVNIWAAPGAAPILDFDGISNSFWGDVEGRGIEIADGVDWLHLRGLTIQNARDNGINSKSDNSIFEQLVTRWNGDSGLQIDGFSEYNLVLNSDSYENYDPSLNGENADGFAIKFEDLGPGNVVRGSRAWGNSDDGWDMWESTTGGVLVEDSWSWGNGVYNATLFEAKDALEGGGNDLTPGNFRGDGNGFKLGQDGGPHVLNRVLVWQNEVRGIDVNGNGFGVQVYNSTVFDSGTNWQFDEPLSSHVLRNNISYLGSLNIDGPVSDTFNSWNLPVTVDSADFLSLDPSIAEGPRQSDGSLPVSDFMRLVPGSDLIDAGTTDVSFVFDGVTYNPVYNGSAPDLGAFEFVAPADADYWKDPVNGAWGTGSNWVDGTTPTDANTASFDVSGSYLVTFDANPDSIRELNISDGTITFQSSGGGETLAVDSASGSQDVTISGGASLILGSSGTGNRVDLTIGNDLSIVGASSSLTVRHGSDLNVSGDVLIDEGGLQIGFPFESVGQFTLAAGKTVTIQNGGSLGFVSTYTTSFTT